jgi:DNA-binding MarR family transcriptional regulator
VWADYPTLDEAIDSDLADGPLAVLAAADQTPTITAHIDKTEFAEQPRQQRENTFRLLSVLDTQCDVYLICTGRTARWLADTHRSDLPLDFDEYLNTTHNSDHPAEKVVDDALSTLDPEGGPVQLLRELADEPTDTVPQARFSEILCRDSSTISQYLTTLEELGLVDRYSEGAGNYVSLRKSGSALLDRVDAEIGHQSELDALFEQTGNSYKRPCNPARGREGEAPPDQQQPAAAADSTTTPDRPATTPYRTRFLSRTTHDATAAVATTGEITVAKSNVADSRTESTETLHVRGVSYDADRDEALVTVRATTGFQYITSVALSLASPRLLDQALPVNRLENIDLSPFMLRSARCIGCLSSEAEENRQELRDGIIEWGKKLAGMTTDLQNGEYEDRDQFRGEIMRSAHGLAGTIAHLLDVAGVNLVREVRIPNGLHENDISGIAKTMSIAASIQSSYGHFATYRQLFEERPKKLQSALLPTVDAADPLGEYIGSLVVRSPAADRVREALADRLSDPLPVRDDAPEIAVQVPIRDVDRSDYVAVMSRVGDRKGLRKTREAVTLCQTLASDPWAVSSALNRLGSESRPREIRLDEVRVALSHLDADDLLPETAPTVSKVVAALLRSAHPLSKTELAEKAGVSTRSLRTTGNLDALVALDLVRETGTGYRFALPFATDEERGGHICPSAIDDKHATTRDVVYELVCEVVDDGPMRTADPDDPLGAPFFGVGLDIQSLVGQLPWLNPWVRVVRLVCNRGSSATRQTVAFGATIKQQPVGVEAVG